MNKEVIYVGGDSFTSAEDIGDLFIEDHCFYSTEELLGKSAEDIRHLSINWNAIKYDFFDKSYGTPKLEEFNDFVNKLRWSAKLNELLDDYEVLNVSGLGGSSNQAIMYRAIIDIMELLKAGRKIKKVILQLTNYPRYMDFTYYEKFSQPTQNKYRIRNWTMGDLNDKQFDLLTSFENGKNHLFHELWSIYQGEKIIENICSVTPIYIDSVWNFWNKISKYQLNHMRYEELGEENSVTDFFHELSIKISDQLLKCSMIHCITDDTEKVWTSNFHLNHVIHERFAKLIKDIYFNE